MTQNETRTAIETGIKYLKECLKDHEYYLGKLDDRRWLLEMETDLKQMEQALEKLK